MSVLAAHNLDFAYPGGKPVLSGVDLEFSSDERVALSAPSGFGKSTLCQLLAGYLAPSSGTITLDGKELSQEKGKAWPVQLIWQHPEQVVDPYLRLDKSIEEAGQVPQGIIEGLGIQKKWLERYPHELSGGELQRCCIARTLAVKPKFLIADEISTMLDAITQVQIWEFLLSYCEKNGTGLIMVTHSDALRDRLATRVVELG